MNQVCSAGGDCGYREPQRVLAGARVDAVLRYISYRALATRDVVFLMNLVDSLQLKSGIKKP